MLRVLGGRDKVPGSTQTDPTTPRLIDEWGDMVHGSESWWGLGRRCLDIRLGKNDLETRWTIPELRHL